MLSLLLLLPLLSFFQITRFRYFDFIYLSTRWNGGRDMNGPLLPDAIQTTPTRLFDLSVYIEVYAKRIHCFVRPS